MGQAQSPIDIPQNQPLPATCPALEFHYDKVAGLKMVHNGHALRKFVVSSSTVLRHAPIAEVTANMGYVLHDGHKYNVKQFHFHRYEQ